MILMATTTALKDNIKAIDKSLATKVDDKELYHDNVLEAYHNACQTIPNSTHINSYLIRDKVREFRHDLRNPRKKASSRFLRKTPVEIMAGFNKAREHGIWCLYDDNKNDVVESDMDSVKDIVRDYRNDLKQVLDRKLDEKTLGV